jgi:hypothetical protein
MGRLAYAAALFGWLRHSDHAPICDVVAPNVLVFVAALANHPAGT